MHAHALARLGRKIPLEVSTICLLKRALEGFHGGSTLRGKQFAEALCESLFATVSIIFLLTE